MYDVIVVGGGPAGLMAAIAAGRAGARTLLIDKGKKPGNKLQISGGGRCNVTNRLPVEEIIRHIPGNGRFLYSAFSVFSNEDIIRFFENLGVKLKEEDHGRMFPVSDRAQDVVEALLDELKRLRVDLRLESPVKKLLMSDDRMIGVRLKSGEEIRAGAIVLATGGKAVPQTGSTGDGYPWAERAGHTVTELFPTEVPITSKEPFIVNRSMQGLALRDVSLSVLNKKGKTLVTHRMDMLFTHFGLSGPAALRCSQFVVKELKKNGSPVYMSIDAWPDGNEHEVGVRIRKCLKEEPKKSIKNSLKGLLPERYLHFLLERANIDLETPGNQVADSAIRELASLMKSFRIAVNGTLPLEKAFVTGGGVSVKEIEPKTMASKKKPGLFFCGEIIDIHGYTGGYNITSALITGHIAGTNAAGISKSLLS
ncbi:MULTISPECIES: NAD(P)/FAD-dependent oxidoreductase [Bacillaceae]|uniref:Flavoprotein n=1 Tax=Domibacillus aminovorans TaxID=29332 RepID=A0A177KSU8_9BACI|nr:MULTISPECIES: NAD(P)/FAD-dependent oxidoreductase [Bacillaceae]OAH56264.1 hypothetical protein AWH48_06235 [Domibacillus aminovorans]